MAFEYGSSIDLYDFLLAKWKSTEQQSQHNFISYQSSFIYENIYKAVLFGHRKLAAHVLENAPAGHGFNAVHTEVLKAENDSDLKCQLRANQCTKKPFSNDLITPIHCACINPNVKYLKTLLSITQDFNIADKKGRRPVHFAAVCEGPTPLEYLITRVSPYELDTLGNTPLHYACLAGRSVNVEILLNYAQKKQEDDSVQTSEVLIDNKYGLGGLNKPNRRGQLPIHLAISRNNYDCIKVLIKYGCNVEYPLPNSMGKTTPLMYACQLGHYKIAKLLVENNSKVEARDRFQRNAVIHAAMCGHTTILSYLLRLGSNPNSQDSSGNTCLHYAAAYGWFYAVKCLVEAGANVNQANEWKLTAFGAAFLKGHVGICDQLLSLFPSSIDVNFRTEDGQTLVMLCVSSTSSLNETSVNQLDYIVNKLNGNVKLRDSHGNNAFHYLAANKLDQTDEEQESLRIRMAHILLKAGCNPSLENNELETAFFTALNNSNFKFARYLLKTPLFNVKLTSKPTPSGQTVLSLMANKCLEMDACYVIFGADYSDQEVFDKFKLEFEEMAKKKDENGLTPFQLACIKIGESLKNTNFDKILENLSRFLIFLYKNCKSDANELIITKKETQDPNDADDEAELEESTSKTKSKKSKFTPALFYLISNNCCKLIEDLNSIRMGIDFNLFDSDGLNLILKSIINKETKFSLKLLELTSIFNLNLVCQNESHLNESILQVCIRHSELEVFSKIFDLMRQEMNDSDKKRNLINLIKHENSNKQNLLHVIAQCDRKSMDNLFMQKLKSNLDSLFDKCVLSDLCLTKDNLGRTALHQCLANSADFNSNLDLELFYVESLYANSEAFGIKDLFGRIPLHYLFLNSESFDSNSFKTDDLHKMNRIPNLETIYLGAPGKQDVLDPVELLTILLKHTGHELIDTKDQFGYTPLHYAAVRGATISSSILISYGASLLVRSNISSDICAPQHPAGNTPLSSAIYYKRETCVLQLLRSVNQNVKIALNDYYYLHPAEYELNKIQDESNNLKCSLVDKSEDLFVKKYIHLYELILGYKWQGISWLVLGDLNTYGLSSFDSIQSALLANEFSLALRLILKHEREMKTEEFLNLILNKSENQFGRSLLHTISCLEWKTSCKDSQTLLRILEKILIKDEQRMKEYFKSEDSLGSTALHYACFMHNFDLIDFIFEFLEKNFLNLKPELLLSKYLDKNKQSAYSILFWQIGRVNYTDQIKEKIKIYTFKYLTNNAIDSIAKANYPHVNIPNFRGEDYLLNKRILDYPAQLHSEQKQENQISALLYAIKMQNFQMCKFMLKEIGFDVNTVDSSQVCALVYAIRTNNLNLCNLLLDFDYKTPKTVITPKPVEVVSKGGARMKNLFNTLLKPSTKQNLDDEENMSDDLSEDNDELNEDQLSEYNLEPAQQETSQEKFVIKSNIIINRLDSKLKTIFHHLACPLDFGSYINLDICKLLFEAFNSSEELKLSDILKRVDSNVKSALDYALKNGNLEIFEEFKRVLNRVDEAKLSKFELNDKYFDSESKIDYIKDADEFLKNYLEQNGVKSQEEDCFQVDPMSNMNRIGRLVWDEKNKVPYDCILTKTDVSYGLYGMHSFYKLQLITQSYEQQFDEKQMCVLFTRWGRIGDVGQCQRTPFSNFKEAKDEFCKVFKQKTGNCFMETVAEKKKSFESKPRRYNLVKLESRIRPRLKDIQFDLFDFKSKNQDILFGQSKFKQQIDYKEFWTDLLDVEYLKNRIHLNSTLSAEYLPLTQLSSENIRKASDILNKQIKPLIEKRMELEKLSKKEHVNEYMNLLDQINKYSNEFYELIPQMNYNYEKLKPISNERELDYQICTLNQLSHAQIACRILMGAKNAMSNLNPYDYVYNCLKCKLELMNPQDMETQYLLRYAHSTAQKSEKFSIKRIFKFQRSQEEQRFEKYSNNKNRYLLWHGTSTENLISIMSKGLVKAPSDSRSNGQRYGKGIYFSDSFEFSAGYSSGKSSKNGNRNYILLCEVALGRIKELRTSYEMLDTLPVEFDSVKALGRLEPDPNKRITLPNGCIVPLGEMVDSQYKPGEYFYSRNLNENQYVVYNESQVCIRYIMQFNSKN